MWPGLTEPALPGDISAMPLEYESTFESLCSHAGQFWRPIFACTALHWECSWGLLMREMGFPKDVSLGI